MAHTQESALVPSLVPGNLIHEFQPRQGEQLQELARSIYVRTTTGEPRQPIIDNLLSEGWSDEAASFLFSQIKAKGPNINFVLERPEEAPDLSYQGPATVQEFRSLAVTGIVVVAASIGYAVVREMINPGGNFLLPGIGVTIGGGMLLQAITRSRKRF